MIGKVSQQGNILTVCHQNCKNPFNEHVVMWDQLADFLTDHQYRQTIQHVYIHHTIQRFQPTNLAYFLAEMPNLKDVSLKNLDTSRTTTMRSMFAGDTSLETLDIVSFETNQVTDICQMFAACRALKDVYCGLDFKLFSPYLTPKEKETALTGCNPAVKFHLIVYERDEHFVPHRVELATYSIEEIKEQCS